MTEPDRLTVGRIGKPQGLRGEVTVEVRTDSPELRFAPGSVLFTDPSERGPLTVDAARDQNGRLIVAFTGVADRNQAEQLRNTVLLVDAADVPPSEDPDDFHDTELIGLSAFLHDGSPLGTVTDVLHLPHGDVLVVARPEIGEALVPFVRTIVPIVDIAKGQIVVDPPQGLLELP